MHWRKGTSPSQSLIERFENFNYRYNERKDKPSPIQKRPLDRMLGFFQFYCQYLLHPQFQHVIKTGCFSILLKRLAISMCRRIQTKTIPILKCLIKDHHELFLVLCPGSKFICRFGPSRSYWCMCFEAKNFPNMLSMEISIYSRI